MSPESCTSQPDEREPGPSRPGRLTCASGLLEYHHGESAVWRLPVPELAALGEYTTDQDASTDDYFLVFVAAGGRFFEASYYAEGRDESLRVLGEILGATLTCRLRHSSGFRSEILWPKALIGAPLFATRARESRSLAGRLRDAIGMRKHQRELSRAVQAHATRRRD